MPTIYLVMGECGDPPEDDQEWVVCSYTDEALAHRHAEKATEAWKAWAASRRPHRTAAKEAAKAWDRSAPDSMFDRAPTYWVEECDLMDALPQP